MDMQKLHDISKELNHKPKVHKKHIKNDSVSNHEPKEHVEHRHNKPRLKHKVKQYKKYFPSEYSNIRVSKDVANWLKTMQQITGDSSRSALLTRFRQIVTPVILNSKSKERKFKHDYKLIIKKEKVIAELNNKM